MEEILAKASEMSLNDISDLIKDLKSLYIEKYNAKYVEVRVVADRKIMDKIEDETGFKCYHEPVAGMSAARGTHIVVVPRELYSDDLARGLKERYEDD